MAEKNLAPCGQAYPHTHPLFILPLDGVLHYFETTGRELSLGEKFSYPPFWAYLVGHMLVGEQGDNGVIDLDIAKGALFLQGASLRISSLHESDTTAKLRIEIVYNSAEKAH